MPAISAHAPGKAILFGEHAVVYNRPAIAVPVHQVRVKAAVFANPKGQPDEIWIEAPEIGLKAWLANLPETQALAILFARFKEALGVAYLPALRLTIHSTIPVAGGLGSGAAVSVAVARALAGFVGRTLTNEQVSALAYEVEKKHHGTPSGIDNTVITYGQPIYFQRGQPFELIHPGAPLTLVIADTGIKSNTALAVGGVRQRWQAQAGRYEALFDRVGHIAAQARQLIESGQIQPLGSLMVENHDLLCEMGVSIPQLDKLVESALQGGAWGAKLCGGGLGGNMLALVEPDAAPAVALALSQAGAVRTIITQVHPSKP